VQAGVVVRGTIINDSVLPHVNVLRMARVI